MAAGIVVHASRWNSPGIKNGAIVCRGWPLDFSCSARFTRKIVSTSLPASTFDRRSRVWKLDRVPLEIYSRGARTFAIDNRVLALIFETVIILWKLNKSPASMNLGLFSSEDAFLLENIIKIVAICKETRWGFFFLLLNRTLGFEDRSLLFTTIPRNLLYDFFPSLNVEARTLRFLELS